ncbi:hypothetical protein LDENG_00225890 [Lucifuga dentata]|nr:hypothetical protein LDENG_00225890 [Lucifuga dentata]
MTRKGSTFIFVTLIYFDTTETTSCLEFLSLPQTFLTNEQRECCHMTFVTRFWFDWMFFCEKLNQTNNLVSDSDQNKRSADVKPNWFLHSKQD